MSSLSSTADAAIPLTVALVGNPNTGKSTLFSALCGVPTRIGNYPGVTVEKKLGRYRDEVGEVIVVDLPGTYSLAARTPDELVSVEVLLGLQSDVRPVDLIVAIVDATNLERNLYLFTQLRELGVPVVLVLNMWDRVTPSGMKIELEALQQRLGVPVLAATASRSIGIPAIKKAIRENSHRAKVTSIAQSLFPKEFQHECQQLANWLADRKQAELPPFMLERLLLDIDGAQAKRLTDSAKLNGLPAYLDEARRRLADCKQRVPALETKVRYAWIRERLDGIVEKPDDRITTVSDRIDKVLTHRIWGIIVFACIMFLIFQSIYNGATFMMNAIEAGQGWLSALVSYSLPPGALRSLVNDGIIAGVGSVLVFLPQILILFFFIGLLEDCGYMARAAFVMDKMMTKLGLSGKSFLPLMSSFACAVPGIMSTRVIENRGDRLITILIAPLMSCSARLPVYVLLIYTFIPEVNFFGWIGLRGLVLFLMHVLGLAVAVPVAWILKKWCFPGEVASFVLELPSYKVPSFRVVFHRVWERAQSFLSRAGTLIFATAVIVWAAGYFPGDHSPLNEVTKKIETLEAEADAEVAEVAANSELESLYAQQRQLSSQLIEQSWLGRIGKKIEPIVRPLGWDWRIGVGVLASFPAREVIIATLGTVYSLGGDVDETSSGLRSAISDASWPDGKPVYTIPVALSIMVFFALCAQCLATLMVIYRETNSWRWPLFTFVYMTLLAYFGAWVTYNVSKLFLG